MLAIFLIAAYIIKPSQSTLCEKPREEIDIVSEYFINITNIDQTTFTVNDMKQLLSEK